MNRKTNIWYNFALGGAIALCVLFIDFEGIPTTTVAFS